MEICLGGDMSAMSGVLMIILLVIIHIFLQHDGTGFKALEEQYDHDLLCLGNM